MKVHRPDRTASVDEAKVARLRASIADGTFRVDPLRIAEAMWKEQRRHGTRAETTGTCHTA
jgi:flagellar biosynthesis anti-sigma factor FlgM